jgi:hypothetical protein
VNILAWLTRRSGAEHVTCVNPVCRRHATEMFPSLLVSSCALSPVGACPSCQAPLVPLQVRRAA